LRLFLKEVMIVLIKHSKLARLFRGASPVNDHDHALVLWLSILDCITSPKDLNMPGTSLKKKGSWYQLTVKGLGVFEFEMQKEQVSILNFTA
jgi:hypothetical protein